MSIAITEAITTLIQGKPLYGYHQVSYFLAKYTNFNGFLEIVYKGEKSPNTIKVDENSIEVELKALLPNAYSSLGEGILKMLRTSYTLKDISIPLPDYSCYVFPALRALEGVMRKLLGNEDFFIEADNNNSFRGIFYKKDSRMIYLVNSDFKQRISNSKVCDALELCYNYYVQQRHTLFHANDFTDLSRFIESKESAAQIIEKVIKTRERFVNKLDKLKKQYQIKLPKGASKEVISVARQLVEKNGSEILAKIAKLHFKTTKEVLG